MKFIGNDHNAINACHHLILALRVYSLTYGYLAEMKLL